MPTQKEAVREISYASSAKSRGGRVLIRTMENATGRPGLIRRAMNYDREVAMGRDFWDVVTRRYGLSLDVIGGTLENIPETGPVVLVANHPYGILDGLIMGYILSARRNGDFRIIAHRVFRKAQDLDRVILPIAFDETPQALQTNIETRKTALRYLDQGGAIGIFPGGTVSTGDIAAHHWPLQEMDIVQMLHYSCGIVQIAQGAIAVFTGFHINHMHRSASGAIVDPRAIKVHVILRITPAQRDIAAGFC